MTASLFGLSPSQALVLLFVVLPFVLAALVIPFVSWRHRNDPKPVLTSEILATGVRGTAEILAVRSLGNILDVKPMVRFVLRVTETGGTGPGSGEPFELEVVQSIPRSLVGAYRPGDRVEVRLTADRSAGAVVLGG
ncbi:MAG TPA: hypothetical protein VFJ79_01420 [Acidimicrobiales bacterium]|nr:hypothetical protein [Acidimicrobiales bacterium]